MAQATAKSLINRVAEAWQRQALWQPMLDKAYAFAMPQRNLFSNSTSEGKKKTDELYDSTAIQAVLRFAGRLQSEFFLADRVKLVPGVLVPENVRDSLIAAMSPLNKLIQGSFSVGSFQTAANEFYMDLCGGRANMLILEGDDDDPVRFVACPRATVAIEEGPWGEVWATFRKMNLEPRQISAMWSDAVLPKDIEDRLTKQKEEGASDKLDLDEAIYFDPVDKVWRYEVLVTAANDNDPGDNAAGISRIVERTYQRSPMITTRYWKVAGEQDGRGPLLNALPDILTVNAVVALTLKNAALAISGVYTVCDDAAVNPAMLKIVPGGMLPVHRNGGPQGPSIQPLETNRDFDVSQFVLDDMRMAIKKQMLDDQLPPDAGPPRTATEIIQRIKEMAQDFGAAYGRIIAEFVVTAVERVAEILVNKRLIKAIPKINRLLIDVEVSTPLARSQKLQEVQTVVEFLQLAMNIVGKEGLAITVAIEDLMPWLAEQLGVDSKFIRPKAQRDQMQKQAAQMMVMQGGGLPGADEGGMQPAQPMQPMQEVQPLPMAA